MSEEVEYRCFIGGLAWATSDRGLRDAFEKYGHLTEAKVVLDKFSGRSRGFGFITFDEKKAMDEAIAAMNGMDLDGRTITADKSQPQGGSGRDHDGDRSRDRDRDRGYDRDRSRPSGGGRGGSGGGDCFKCGKPGHFARECPDESGRDGGGGGGRYSSRDDRYSSKDDRYGGKDDRYSSKDDRYSAKDDRYGAKEDRYGRDRYGPDRSGERALEDVAGMMAAVVVQEERGMAVLHTIAPEMAAFTRILLQRSNKWKVSAFGSLVRFEVRCSVWF